MRKPGVPDEEQAKKITNQLIEIQAVKREIKSIEEKIPKIETQIESAEKNIGRFGRPVLGGGDVTTGNIARAIESDLGLTFKETLEDLGASAAREDSFKRVATESASDEYFQRTGRSFRHHKNADEAIRFLNSNAVFFGLTKSTEASSFGLQHEELISRYKTNKPEEFLVEGRTHQANRLETFNVRADRNYITNKVREIRSGGKGKVNLNLATRSELLGVKGFDESIVDEKKT